MPINGTLYAGMRYDFFSVYVTYNADLLDVYNPTYEHLNANGGLINDFEEDVDFNTVSFGVGLNF